MTYAIKTATRIQAWELGAGSDMEEEMLRRKKIIKHPDGTFELFSLEAAEGKGQIAKPGDFFKVDKILSDLQKGNTYFAGCVLYGF